MTSDIFKKQRFYEPLTGKYFYSTIFKLNMIAWHLNEAIRHGTEINVNDWLHHIGLVGLVGLPRFEYMIWNGQNMFKIDYINKDRFVVIKYANYPSQKLHTVL